MCFTGKGENFAEMTILKDIFIFLANGHLFQKYLFLVEILIFLKEVSSVFEKKCHFFAKEILGFGQMSEILSTVIKSCCANFGGKVASVFLNMNFCAKISILAKKKKMKFWEKC